MLGGRKFPESESMEHTINIYFALSLNLIVITFIFYFSYHRNREV